MECEHCKFETHVVYINEQVKKICYRCKVEQGHRECEMFIDEGDEDKKL